MAAEQARKAADPPPPAPARGERLVKSIEHVRYGTPNGFYPYFDSVCSGGGFTGGAGYRRYVGDATYVDVKGGDPRREWRQRAADGCDLSARCRQLVGVSRRDQCGTPTCGEEVHTTR